MAPTVTRWGPGEPASLEEITSIFDGRTLGGRAVPWWLAGGYAIELAVGLPVRDHGDIGPGCGRNRAQLWPGASVAGPSGWPRVTRAW